MWSLGDPDLRLRGALDALDEDAPAAPRLEIDISRLRMNVEVGNPLNCHGFWIVFLPQKGPFSFHVMS